MSMAEPHISNEEVGPFLPPSVLPAQLTSPLLPAPKVPQTDRGAARHDTHDGPRIRLSDPESAHVDRGPGRRLRPHPGPRYQLQVQTTSKAGPEGKDVDDRAGHRPGGILHPV